MDIDPAAASRVAVGDGEMACFAAWDGGVGIPAERLGAKLDPGVRAGASTTRRIGGAGLGLAIRGRLVRFQREHFGPMLKDRPMPGMDGLEAIRRIRAGERVSAGGPPRWSP